MEIRAVCSVEEFHDLGPAWETLLRSSGQESPFLTHDWFACCLLAYRQGREPHILLMHEGSDLVGIAPLWLRSPSAGGAGPERSFITVADTPYSDLITRPDRGDAVVGALVGYAGSPRRGAWRRAFLSPWPSWSRHYPILRQALRQRGLPHYVREASRAPHIAVHGDWETFVHSLSPRFRKAQRRIHNRMREIPELTLQMADRDDDGDVLEAVFRVAERSWKAGEQLALTSREETRSFFAELTRRASQRGWLRVWILRIGGTPVAVEYDLQHGGVVYALRADYDEAYRRHSPGGYLEWEIVRNAFESGLREYNSGPGMNVYKLRWTDTARENHAVVVCPRSIAGAAEWFLEGWVPERRRTLKRWLSGGGRGASGAADLGEGEGDP